MRTQQEISKVFRILNSLGISYSKISRDSGLPLGTILYLAKKKTHEYQAEPQSLRKADDVVNSYIEKLKEII